MFPAFLLSGFWLRWGKGWVLTPLWTRTIALSAPSPKILKSKGTLLMPGSLPGDFQYGVRYLEQKGKKPVFGSRGHLKDSTRVPGYHTGPEQGAVLGCSSHLPGQLKRMTQDSQFSESLSKPEVLYTLAWSFCHLTSGGSISV